MNARCAAPFAPPVDLALLIQRVNAGAPSARDALFAGAYRELRKLAHARLRHGGRSALVDTTMLVHESYLRFARAPALRSAERRAFFDYASRVMRTVIVDAVRENRAQRRGGGLVAVTLTTQLLDELGSGEAQVLGVNAALDALAEVEPALAKVVEMRYFGGYSDDEIGAALGVTARTVRRHWHKSRLLLAAMLAD